MRLFIVAVPEIGSWVVRADDGDAAVRAWVDSCDDEGAEEDAEGAEATEVEFDEHGVSKSSVEDVRAGVDGGGA